MASYLELLAGYFTTCIRTGPRIEILALGRLLRICTMIRLDATPLDESLPAGRRKAKRRQTAEEKEEDETS